ncbi:MAG: hypothetical protein GX455_15270 [Phycisphaerae bacterium]|nr:hypothetical protein [Phycisphaerae bacterium]
MSKILKTSAEGRKCLYPRCKCILSIYNHQGYCHIHLERILQEEKAKAALLKRPVTEHP